MIQSIEDLSPFEQMGLINISYSRLSEFETCKAKYFYDYIIKEEKQFGPAAALGSTMHAVLEDFYGTELNLLEMFKDLERHREKYDPDRKITEELMNAGRVMLAEFQSRHGDELPLVIGKEIPFQLVIGSALISGFIDVVEERGKDTVAITDYKTGRAEVAVKDVATNLQLGIYALAMARQYPGKKIRAELYYLRTGRRKGHSYSEQDLLDMEKMVAAKVEELINTINFSYTDTPHVCGWCDYRHNGVCGKYPRG